MYLPLQVRFPRKEMLRWCVCRKLKCHVPTFAGQDPWERDAEVKTSVLEVHRKCSRGPHLGTWWKNGKQDWVGRSWVASVITLSLMKHGGWVSVPRSIHWWDTQDHRRGVTTLDKQISSAMDSHQDMTQWLHRPGSQHLRHAALIHKGRGGGIWEEHQSIPISLDQTLVFFWDFWN